MRPVRTGPTAPSLAILALLSLLSFSPPARAHDPNLGEALVVLRHHGWFTVELSADLDAIALGTRPGGDPTQQLRALLALSPEERAALGDDLRTQAARWVRVEFDGRRVPLTLDLPLRAEGPAEPAFSEAAGHYGAPRAPGDSTATPPPTTADADNPPGAVGPTDARGLPGQLLIRPSWFGPSVRFTGRIPPDAREFVLHVSALRPPTRLTIFKDDHNQPFVSLVHKGGSSEPYPLTAAEPPIHTGYLVLGQYLVLGFAHIVPLGWDHILFVCGLFLLSPRLHPLLWQVTAFTLAHSVTLALSVCGVISAPASIVEPLIAASIAYVAIENLFTTRLHFWRPLLVFGFGLLHGLGFAGVLGELGLPESQFVSALVGFNLGVEFGQFAVIAGAFLLVGWWRKHPWYRTAIVIPASAVIAIIAFYTAVARVMGFGD